MTKEQILPASLLWLLLFRAGIEKNPGPWPCNICKKNLATTSVQCSSCSNWMHIKCSSFKTSRERSKLKTWTGPCCITVKSPKSYHPQKRDPPPARRPPPSPPPPPPPQYPPPQPQHTFPQQSDDKAFKILQYNINGLSGKIDELLHYMDKNNIKIAAIQETKLTDKSKPIKTPNYTMIRKDRGKDKGGGIAFLIQEDIIFNTVPTPVDLENDEHIETMTINIPGKNSNHQIRNVYLPPVSSCSPQYQPKLDHLFDNLQDSARDSALVIGDINAHHESWLTGANSDTRGRLLVNAISDSNFGILNEDFPTRVTDQASTSPDLSLASPSILPSTTWKTESKLSSDHLPITITISAEMKKIKSENRTYINFYKADWKGFQKFTENIFSKQRNVRDVHKSEKYFRRTVVKAAKRFIPNGRILKTINSIPTEAAVLIEERDSLRENDPSNPRIRHLNREIDSKIKHHKKSKWQEHLKKCTPGSNIHWQTIKNLNNQQQPAKNQGISFNGQMTNDPKTMTNKFNQQYTPTPDTKPSKEYRVTVRRFKKATNDPEVIITTEQTAKAIKASKNSKALGPDEISPIMLKHLGPHGIQLLTNIYNACIQTSTIPSIWKTGRIIPLLKPGKATDKGPSYRPISLLSPPAKILEAVLLPEIRDAIELADHQHGYRKGRSTTTALHDISEHITKGLNQKQPVQRTVSVAIDLSRAFDTVDHNLLLQDIYELNLNSHIKRFLCAYLRGRQTFVEFRGVKSKYRKVKQGVPQGGVLSPTLFNLYMSKMPSPPEGIKLVSYADDSNVLKSGTNIESLCQDINQYLNTLDEWFISRNLFISPAKSTATLFTTSKYELNLELPVEINDVRVPTVKQPKFLGVTYDNLMSFNHHAAAMKTKLQNKNNILKVLTGTSWGQDKEIIVSTYKSIGQSILNYACPVWTPSMTDNTFKTLQRAQNTALKTALGCVKMSDENHIHNETKIMPVQAHCEMLSKQYLLSTQKENHPVKINLGSPPPRRTMKETLKTRFGEEIKQLTNNQQLDDTTYKQKLKTFTQNL